MQLPNQAHTIEAMVTCPKCGHLCEMEQYIGNWGICDNCWNELYDEYLKEQDAV